MKSKAPVALILLVLAGAASWAWLEKTKAATPPPELAGEPGARAFFRYGCVECHSLRDVEGAVGTLGPPLDGANSLGKDVLRESILNPAAVVKPGYLNVMPSFAGKMPEEDLNSLVDWLHGL